MKINKHFAVKLIATVIFIASTRCDCGGGGKSSSDTSSPRTQTKPEEIYSHYQREGFSDTSSTGIQSKPKKIFFQPQRESFSDTNVTIAQIKPEEMFSQSERENLKKSISNMDAASAIAKFEEIFVMYGEKLAKEFPNIESDEKILKEVFEKRLMPYWYELKTIAKEGIKNPTTLSAVLNEAANVEREIQSQGVFL